MMYLTQEQILFGVTVALATVLIITCILLIIVLCKLKKLRRRVEALTRGKDAESMEDSILNFFEILKNHFFQALLCCYLDEKLNQ